MRLLLVHRNKQMAEAWWKYFADQPEVVTIEADLCEVCCDAIVSPANSSGFMNGGLDYMLGA